MTVLKYLSAVLRFFNENDYTHRENVAILVSDIYEQNPEINLDEFKNRIKGIRSDFFRINKINRSKFAESVFALLNKTKNQYEGKKDRFEIARDFVSRFLEIGFEKDKYEEDRKRILKLFRTVAKPHLKLLEVLDSLLQKIDKSYQIGLHGVKEYSGIDLAKKVDTAIIGFQMKTVNDDISEDKIRAQASKAQEYKLDGFVWIYGRPPSKDVDNSVQAAFHHFMRINETKSMYCAIVLPEVLAELLIKYSIEFRE